MFQMNTSPQTLQHHSEMTLLCPPPLASGTRQAILTPSQSLHQQYQPSCLLSHTPPSLHMSAHLLIPVHNHHSKCLASHKKYLIHLLHYIRHCRPIYMKIHILQHTHTRDILQLLGLLSSVPGCVSGWLAGPAPPRYLVGAGCDWFLQLHGVGSCIDLEAAIAGLTHTSGLKQLLAWHRDLLVAAAGTEHIPTVPTGWRQRQHRFSLAHRGAV